MDVGVAAETGQLLGPKCSKQN